MSFFIGIEADSEGFNEQLDKIDKDVAETGRKINNVARKGFNTIVALGQITGNAVDQSYQLMAQAAFVAAETVLAISAAESFTIVGAINAGLGVAIASALFIQALNIHAKRGEASIEVQGLISIANEWRTY